MKSVAFFKLPNVKIAGTGFVLIQLHLFRLPLELTVRVFTVKSNFSDVYILVRENCSSDVEWKCPLKLWPCFVGRFQGLSRF